MKIKIVSAFYLLMFFLIACEKETEFDIPLILTGEVTGITEDGVILNAKIRDFSKESIKGYGFVINNEKVDSGTEGKILIEGNKNEGVINYNLKSGLKTGQSYEIRAFVETVNETIYGNVVTFQSQGSLAPVIKSFYPQNGPIGTKVTIEGENFGYLKSEISIEFGSVSVQLDSLTNEKIIVTIPEITESENALININVAGKNVISEEFFELWFPWTKIADNENFWCETYFQIENIGYMLHWGKLYIFNLETLKWEETKNTPILNNFAVSATTLNNKAYILSTKQFWEYNPDLNQWEELTYPSDLVINASYTDILYREKYQYFLTSLNGQITLGTFNKNGTTWEYDLNNDKWTKTINENTNIGKNPLGSFTETIDSKLYIGLKLNEASQLWSIAPSNKEWNLIGDLPINSYSFWGQAVIHNKLYLCLGYRRFPSEYSDQMWEYDIAVNKWKQLHNCPNTNTVQASFSYNNKAYFFAPWRTWEFDPTKN